MILIKMSVDEEELYAPRIHDAIQFAHCFCFFFYVLFFISVR